jgi:hypothetical protein
MKNRHSTSNGQGQGMNWIRPVKRLAIYLRDGFACCYCGEGIEAGSRLTLDHVKPHSKGGVNHERNLVTACLRCNSARGNRSLASFAVAAASYINGGLTPETIKRHVARTIRRPLEMAAAKAAIDRRGGFSEALTELATKN